MTHDIESVLSFHDPIAYADADFREPKPDPEYVEEWESNSFFMQMMDAWGEVSKAFGLQGEPDKLAKQLGNIRDICLVIYAESDDVISENEKWEIKAAEWMLYDYLVGGNRMGQSELSARKWWYDMSHGINFDLL